MTIYTTREWKGYGKQNYYWNEYRLEGKTVKKYKCNRFKSYDGKENTWCKDEIEVESWTVNSPDMPQWLHQYLKVTTTPRLLTISRRCFFAGTVSLIVCISFVRFDFFKKIVGLSSSNILEIFEGLICAIFLMSPLLYALLMLFTVFNHNRINMDNGEKKSAFLFVLNTVWQDFLAPVCNIKAFVVSISSRQTKKHGLIILRFIEIIILIIICGLGVIYVVNDYWKLLV